VLETWGLSRPLTGGSREGEGRLSPLDCPIDLYQPPLTLTRL
jgi:hypothetical protein